MADNPAPNADNAELPSELVLPATLDALKPLRAFVTAAADAAGLERKKKAGLKLAVDEIATNVINHGYAENGLSGDIRCTQAAADGHLTITLEDHAVEYDPTKANVPTQEQLKHKPLEEREVGGLGVMLALKKVDDYRYERDGETNRNIMRMTLDG